jgi:hypothetical protein
MHHFLYTLATGKKRPFIEVFSGQILLFGATGI